MGSRLHYSGLVIAGLGFVLTRFTVTLAVYEDPVRFYFAGVVPLGLGLGLAAFGVALVVADVDASLVRTTALWCVIGTTTMLVLVVLTLLGSGQMEATGLDAMRSRTYLSNFLIGGSVGGTMTGLYAARTRRQHRELHQQANRLEVLNRLLRHEVLNAVNVIQGHATDGGRNGDPGVIARHARTIEDTIEKVTYLTWSTRTRETSGTTTDLASQLRASVEETRARYPDAEITLDGPDDALPVYANERLSEVFVQLIENGIVHSAGATPTVAVAVETTATSANVAVRDDGAGLPPQQQSLLETGAVTEFDDPRDGYGLNVVRLLVESFDGAIETTVTDDGTTVTVSLVRADAGELGVAPDQSGLTGIRPSVPHLTVILGAALLAGVPFGVAAEQLGGSVAAIGVFYGINDPVVGWLTHEFHSAVFGFAFAGIVSFTPERYRDHVPAYALVGVAWGLVLWIVAAGIVAPIWLNLVGIPAGLPTFSPVSLVSHVLWGLSLGVLTALGYRYVAPWLAALGSRL